MIQRWRLGEVVGMFKARDGEWVRYADHEAVVKKLVETLESTIEWVGSSWPELESLDWEDWRQTVSKIVAKAKGEEPHA